MNHETVQVPTGDYEGRPGKLKILKNSHIRMIHNRKTLLFGVVRQCHILQDPEVISQGPNFTAEIQNVIPEAVDVLKPIRGQAS